MNVGKPSLSNIHWFSTREFSWGKGLMSVDCVGKLSLEAFMLLGNRYFTIQKGFMFICNIGIRKYTLEKGLTRAINGGKPSLTVPVLFITRKFVTQSLSAMIVGKPSGKPPSLLCIKGLKLDKGLINAYGIVLSYFFNLVPQQGIHAEKSPMNGQNVERPSVKTLPLFSTRGSH
jgi:hypothetical protein